MCEQEFDSNSSTAFSDHSPAALENGGLMSSVWVHTDRRLASSSGNARNRGSTGEHKYKLPSAQGKSLLLSGGSSLAPTSNHKNS